MKRFKVVAESTIMDAEANVRYRDEAEKLFIQFRDSGSYSKVYLMDNETGELYRTYDKTFVAGGVRVDEWFSIAGDL